MYFKFTIFCFFHVFAVHGFGFLDNHDAFRHEVISTKGNTDPSIGANICTRWIEQQLDHFDSNETRTWKMRYYERRDYWRPNGPIILYMGGESPANSSRLTLGLVVDLAKETKGAMFMSEHRYYGKSQPVNRSNLKEMRFLSVVQALADNAKLLKTIKKNLLFKNSKIVVIGGSYAGNLAAWMKLIYPDLVDAAIASSAPVQAKSNFYEYPEIVNRNYETYGTRGCIENIQNMFQRYDSLFKTKEGIRVIKEDENICDECDLSKPENKQLFFLSKIYNFLNISQYGTTDEIMEHCSNLNRTKATIFQTDDENNCWNKERNCFNFDFDNLINHIRNNNYESLSWNYQTCTEFGYFQTTTSDHQPFSKNIPVEFYHKKCTALFGPDFDKDRVDNGVKKINEMFGGKYPNVTQVVFVNGELDPWSALGVLKNISNDAPAVYIPKASHCKDLQRNKDTDHKELKEARITIKNLIKKWIGAGAYN